jgi:hypothetical protein
MALSTDDLVAIQQQYAAYCLAVDDGDGKAFSACFTPDGSLDTAGGAPIAGTEALASFAAGLAPGMRHVVANVHLEGDGGEARGRAYVIVYNVAAGPATLLVTGRYRDELQLQDGKWLFTVRHFTADS